VEMKDCVQAVEGNDEAVVFTSCSASLEGGAIVSSYAATAAHEPSQTQ
jgi:hypothetical protein